MRAWRVTGCGFLRSRAGAPGRPKSQTFCLVPYRLLACYVVNSGFRGLGGGKQLSLEGGKSASSSAWAGAATRDGRDLRLRGLALQILAVHLLQFLGFFLFLPRFDLFGRELGPRRPLHQINVVLG